MHSSTSPSPGKSLLRHSLANPFSSSPSPALVPRSAALPRYSGSEPAGSATMAARDAASPSQRQDACMLFRARLGQILNPRWEWQPLSDADLLVFCNSCSDAVCAKLMGTAQLPGLVSPRPGAMRAPPLAVARWLAFDMLNALAGRELDARAFVAWKVVCQHDFMMPPTEIERVIDQISIFFAAERQGHEKPAKRRSSRTRLAMIGGAAVVGGGVLAATGAVAAPMMAGAAVAAHATGTAAFLSSTTGMAAVAGSLGLAGATRTGYQMARRTGGLREFDFLPLSATLNKAAAATTEGFESLSDSLITTVGISGWLPGESTTALADFWAKALPEKWAGAKEALMFDRKELVAYGNALERLVAAPLFSLVTQTAVDSPFAVAKNKAKQAGQELARALMARALGRRPVNLVGFGFGACCAFYCLETLALSGPAGMGLVADVCLFGTPMRPDPMRWQTVRRVASGAVVNFFNPHDEVLAIVMSASSKSFSVAGVQSVRVAGITDVEVSATAYEIGRSPHYMHDLLYATLRTVPPPYSLRPRPPPAQVRSRLTDWEWDWEIDLEDLIEIIHLFAEVGEVVLEAASSAGD